MTDARELKAIEAGALLHDIGKLAIPDYVLNKPSALTPAEFETMKKHASMGARILTAVEFPYPVVPIVRHHHERWDGRGYPDGLIGPEIPLGARILAVVDCFDALTSDRPYRARLTDPQAIGILRSRRGTFYDPGVVEKFIELLPTLREADESRDQGDPHASVVADFAGAATPVMVDVDARPAATPAAAVPRAVQELIDAYVARRRGTDICLFSMNGDGALQAAYVTARLRSAVAGLRMTIGSGVSGWVAANRSAIRRAQPLLDLGGIADAFALKTCACLPVFNRAELFGVLTLYTAEDDLPDVTVDLTGLLAQEVGLLLAREHLAVADRVLAASPSIQIAAAS